MAIYFACALTVALEVPFLALTVSRERGFIEVAALANVATNLALNLALWGFAHISCGAAQAALYPLEGCAVAAEFLVYRRFLAPQKPGRLFLLTLAANVLSYTVGLFVF